MSDCIGNLENVKVSAPWLRGTLPGSKKSTQWVSLMLWASMASLCARLKSMCQNFGSSLHCTVSSPVIRNIPLQANSSWLITRCTLNTRKLYRRSTMASPTPAPAEISNVLAMSVVDPTTVTQLESYVRAQVNALYGPTTAAGGVGAEPSHPYNFAANLALTKLYQFFPHLADESCTALVLLLALLEYPSTDFMALSYLVPERVQEREPCATLKRCSDLLEQSQFGTFWVTFRELVINDSASEELKMATASPAAVAKIRTNVLDLLGLTYKVAPIDAVLSAMDLKDAPALRDYVNGDATAKKIVENVDVDGGKVVFTSREENTKKGRVFKEAVGLDAISAALAKGVMAHTFTSAGQ